MTDSHADLVAAGYLRRGLSVEYTAARTGLTVVAVYLNAKRLRTADERAAGRSGT